MSKPTIRAAHEALPGSTLLCRLAPLLGDSREALMRPSTGLRLRSAASALFALAASVLLTGCVGCPGLPYCASGEDLCDGRCVELSSYRSDPRNCGSCGRACAAAASCASGECVCPAGQEVCNGACVSVTGYATDPANCGGCGISCGPGTCSDGACQCGAFTSCPGQSSRCIDGLTDAQNCGFGDAACGHACLAGGICEGGACRCPSGTTACPVDSPTACRDLASDEANCGSCGFRCLVGGTCVSGACGCPAEAPDVCTGKCVNLQTDPYNCGTCGWQCGVIIGLGPVACAAGQCTCPAAMPLSCGRSCCPGTECCDTTYDRCQDRHSNGSGVPGLGQEFYDCTPIGNYDRALSLKAAQAWQGVATIVAGTELGCASQSCVGWQTTTACAVWCYGVEGDPLRGRASLNAQSAKCLCPLAGPPNWY